MRKGLVPPQFLRLLKAKSEKEFIDVLWENFSWVIYHDILDHDIASVGVNYFRNLRCVYLKKPYKGEHEWFINKKGELVRPYYPPSIRK